MDKEISQWRTKKSKSFLRTILSLITAGSVGESPKSIEKGPAYIINDMISGLIYAMPCIVFVCVY